MDVQPLLIVVTGRPGSGKSSLAHPLARAIRCPVISRDELKEGLINTIGEGSGPGDEIGRQVYDLFFETLERLLDHRISLIAEAAFQHKLWAPKLTLLRTTARVRLIVCSVDESLSQSRRAQRELSDPNRRRFHTPMVPGFTEEYQPPQMDLPTLSVDTSDGYRPAFEEIVAFARP